jgi:membrane protein required for colicin V production
MNVVDMVVAGLLVVNAILGAIRGFALQAFRLGSIVLAVWLAQMFAGNLAVLVEPWLSWPLGQREALAWVVIGGAVYLIMVMIGHYAKNLLQRLRMGGADRALGTLLGGLKGALIAAVGMYLVVAIGSAGSLILPETFKTEMQNSRAFEFYLKAIWPISEDFVRTTRENFVAKPR